MSGAVRIVDLALHVIRASVPYACAALGGIWSERSGVVNVGLEGMLLAGAFGGIAGQLATGWATAGIGIGVACATLFGVAHGVLVARYRVDAIVSGLALNLVAFGATRVALRGLYESSSNSPAVPGVERGPLDGFVISTIAVAALTAWALRKTRLGLHTRAAGEDPVAARAVGIDVVGVRIRAVAIGAAICGMGGVALSFDQGQFQSGMSGGRGFIALAAVILSGWRPLHAIVACLLFSIFDTAQIALQGAWHIPSNAIQALPFIATLVALGVVGALSRHDRRASRVPQGLGMHADV